MMERPPMPVRVNRHAVADLVHVVPEHLRKNRRISALRMLPDVLLEDITVRLQIRPILRLVQADLVSLV